MVDWAAARAFTESACAEIFDVTPCRALPMKKGLSVNHPMTADDSRAAFDFLGTIDLQPPSDMLRRHKPGDPRSPGETVTYAAVLTARVADWPWSLRRCDQVAGLGKVWRVEASERDGSERPAFYLSEVRHAGS